MNIALEQTEEHVNGVVTNKYGDTFIRGNNGTSHREVVLNLCLIEVHIDTFPVLYISAAEPL